MDYSDCGRIPHPPPPAETVAQEIETSREMNVATQACSCGGLWRGRWCYGRGCCSWRVEVPAVGPVEGVGRLDPALWQ
jgi:hypothetical protein